MTHNNDDQARQKKLNELIDYDVKEKFKNLTDEQKIAVFEEMLKNGLIPAPAMDRAEIDELIQNNKKL